MMRYHEIEDASDWDALVRESDGDLPVDVPDTVLLAQYRDAKRRHGKAATVMRWIIVLILIVTVAVFLSLGALPADAHDCWINHGGYKSGDGTHCCGDNDCSMFSADEVKAGKTGWLVLPLQEIVPYSEAQASEDGKFWRCKRYDGSRRCFFAPQPSS